MLATELLIDLFFMCDIALNFNTGYILEQARAGCPEINKSKKGPHANMRKERNMCAPAVL